MDRVLREGPPQTDPVAGGMGKIGETLALVVRSTQSIVHYSATPDCPAHPEHCDHGATPGYALL